MSPRRRAAALVAAVALSTLAGCSTEQPLPRPQPEASAAAAPVVLDRQVTAVVEDVIATIAAGDAAGDAALLAPRVDGTALAARQASYRVRERVPEEPLPAVGGTLLGALIPRGDDWPRTVPAVVQPEGDAAVPQVLVLTQADPRSPYRLTGWADLLPGSELPAASAPGQGAEPVAADDGTGLPTTPQNAAARYADVLTRGTASEYASVFADDSFRQREAALQEAERQSAGDFFTYEVSHRLRDGSVWAVRTADGGALVLATLDGTRSFTVSQPGATLTLTPALAALAGAASTQQRLEITSVSTVLLALPPSDEEAPMAALAASRAEVAARLP